MFCNPSFDYSLTPARQVMGQQPGIPAYPTPSPYMTGGTTIAAQSFPAASVGDFEQGPPTTTNIGYIPAFLKTQIGKRMRIQFLIGSDSFLDKSGTLVGVGISYVLLRDDDTGDIIMADMYSIKFVNIFQ